MYFSSYEERGVDKTPAELSTPCAWRESWSALKLSADELSRLARMMKAMPELSIKLTLPMSSVKRPDSFNEYLV